MLLLSKLDKYLSKDALLSINDMEIPCFDVLVKFFYTKCTQSVIKSSQGSVKVISKKARLC